MTSAGTLNLDTVSVVQGEAEILRDVSLDLAGPGLVAVIGPNGAGKTTLLRAMAGLIPFRGRIQLNGVSVGVLPRSERARLVGYLAQGQDVHWPLSARDVVSLGRHAHGMADPARMTTADAAIVEASLTRCDALAFAERSVQSLSGGERARVMLARVLAGEPQVILTDEPIAALDPLHQLKVMADLKREATQGRLVIVVTHDLTLAARFADEIILLAEGSLLAKGRPQDVLTANNLAKAYGIRALHLDHEGQSFVVPWQALEP
jgi:iron complex transport system ATP-binding protein